MVFNLNFGKHSKDVNFLGTARYINGPLQVASGVLLKVSSYPDKPPKNVWEIQGLLGWMDGR